MRSNGKTIVIRDNMSVTLAYKLYTYERGELAYQKVGTQKFIQGAGEIPPGLERELYGMKIGEVKEIHVMALDGSGELDTDDIVEVSRDEIPLNVDLKPGAALHLEFKDGDWVDVFVKSVNNNTVQLSLNHPLLGKDFRISVLIEDISP